jgi:hypothetical protein
VSDAPLLTRADLDKAKCHCGQPDCEGDTVLLSTCHRGSFPVVAYRPDLGQLVLICPVCRTPVARVQVAWAVPS